MVMKQQLQRPGSLQERRGGQKASVAASKSVTRASVVARKQQFHCPGALQEHGSAQEAAVLASGSVVGALQWPGLQAAVAHS